jgi:hypothetical protein
MYIKGVPFLVHLYFFRTYWVLKFVLEFGFLLTFTESNSIL